MRIWGRGGGLGDALGGGDSGRSTGPGVRLAGIRTPTALPRPWQAHLPKPQSPHSSNREKKIPYILHEARESILRQQNERAWHSTRRVVRAQDQLRKRLKARPPEAPWFKSRSRRSPGWVTLVTKPLRTFVVFTCQMGLRTARIPPAVRSEALRKDWLLLLIVNVPPKDVESNGKDEIGGCSGKSSALVLTLASRETLRFSSAGII